MARIAFAPLEAAPTGPLLAASQTTAIGEVHTSQLITGSERPIWTYRHELAAGAELRWSRPLHGHCLYVESGSAAVNGSPAVAADAIFVEHGAEATLVAGSEGAVLAHFHGTDAQPSPKKSGGHVHVVGQNAAEKPVPPDPKVVLKTYPDGRRDFSVRYLVSGCESCDLWLHRTNRWEFLDTGAHAHSANEVLYLVRGEVHVGARIFTPGAAIAVDGDTRYVLKTGDEGVDFVNFRPTFSWLTRFDEKGKLGDAVPEHVHK
jgi:redox-sensitive bicupin YhaK (pirin superfamily)